MAEACHPIIQPSAFNTEPNLSPTWRKNHYSQLQAVGIASIPSRTLAQLQRAASSAPNPFKELPTLIAQLLGAKSLTFCSITKLFGTKPKLFAAIIFFEQFFGTFPFVRRRERSALIGIGN